jgi:hypothetical protein
VLVTGLNNGMRVDSGVEVHDRVEVGNEELVLHPPVGVRGRHTLVLHVAGESLVQPAPDIRVN